MLIYSRLRVSGSWIDEKNHSVGLCGSWIVEKIIVILTQNEGFMEVRLFAVLVWDQRKKCVSGGIRCSG